ncbi:hypothetical protein ACWA5Z_02895 [Testudinibacter sp. P80/BLE/0925]|uniref:hypothetical protein n=1 Tax=Testudinibacter sp. TW-1 TaxID=3417757 RepID=UPI003D366888
MFPPPPPACGWKNQKRQGLEAALYGEPLEYISLRYLNRTLFVTVNRDKQSAVLRFSLA